MNERKFEKLVEGLAEENHNPSSAARHRMWQQVQGQQSLNPAKSRFRYLKVAAAMAAVLVVGIGIGRWSNPVVQQGPVADLKTEAAARPDVYQQSTLALFNRADALLTEFRLGDCSTAKWDPTSQWAAGMLMQTRLLQGTSAGQNPELGPLLMDLELVLAQIVGINPEHCDQDLAWIRSGLNKRSTLDRLRVAINRSGELNPL
jgi:hypothetical protein